MDRSPTARELLDIFDDVLPSKDYLVTYRIVGDTAHRTREERYEDLVGELRSSESAEEGELFEDPGHVATSSWTIRTNDRSAEEVVERLAVHLVAGRDALQVFEVVIENHARLARD